MNESTKYTLYGALFGCCFPIGSIFFLYVMGEIADTSSLLSILAEAHQNSLLWVIDTAPLFLGLFARLAGVRQDRILRFSASLEQQVTDKTESLRLALDESRKANEIIAHMAEHDSLTATDTVARWGGDEFAVLLPETHKVAAIEVANKLLRLFNEAKFSISGHELHPSASIGMALFPDHGSDFDALIVYADAAM